MFGLYLFESKTFFDLKISDSKFFRAQIFGLKTFMRRNFILYFLDQILDLKHFFEPKILDLKNFIDQIFGLKTFLN